MTCRFLPLVLLALPLAAQLKVDLSPSPTDPAYQIVYGYSGGNLTYVCYSPSVLTTGTRPSISVAISAATNASPVVFTSTGHGFNINSRPQVTISGATGSWTPVNGIFTATIIDANTFSIPMNSTGFSTLTGTLVFTTTAPRLTVQEWTVLLYAYDGSGNLISKTSLAGSNSLRARCSDATSTTLNIQ